MRIGIYANLSKDKGETRALAEYLLDKGGYEVALSDELKPIGSNLPYYDKNALAKNSEIIIVLGGDGAVLRIAKECARTNTKILAVNFGHMGFLTELEKSDYLKIFDAVSARKFIIDKRELLKIEYGGREYLALNEAVVERGARMVRSEVYVDGALIDRYSSDGIIVSTPTGSTAYSLSAGGPVVSPEVKALIVTPICPHTLYSRPIVIDGKSSVEIKLLTPEARLEIDGVETEKLSAGESVIIKNSGLFAEFIRLKKYNFYEKFLDKMSFWRVEK